MPASAANVYDEITSFNCTRASSFVEKEVCKVKDLAYKDRILSDLYTIAKQDKEWVIDEQRIWIKNRNACESDKCISQLYVLRISELTKLLNYYETDVSCGATLRCNLIKRMWLGYYKGRKVFYDQIRRQECLKGCYEPTIQHRIYEIQNGKIIKETEWAGELDKIKNITPFPWEVMRKPGSLNIQDGDTIIFYSDTGSNDKGMVKADRLVKTKKGWKRKPYKK
jgi:hypothetical protein